jgi:hypothetical protein
LKRTGLLALMAVLSLNIWTGSPLAALWIGSRVQGDVGQASLRAIAAVAVSMAAISVALLVALNAVGRSYDRLTGHTASVRRHTPWLRSLSGDRPREVGGRGELTALDVVVVATVVLAVVAFEIWFFFYSTSPIDQRSGR